MPDHATNFGLAGSEAEARPVLEHAIPLPRAVLRRNTAQLLDGEWAFCIDAADRRLHEQWWLGHTYEGVATWPGSIEAHMAAARGDTAIAGGDAVLWHDTVVAGYERTFTLPSLGADAEHAMLQLTFGACGYETHVWLNGRLLRTIEGETVHFGEYTSFSYELKPCAR